MTITLSRADYWDLIEPADVEVKVTPNGDLVRPCPAQLGKGYYKWVPLSEGLELSIDDYYLNEDVVIAHRDRPHSLEYVLEQTEHASGHRAQYYLYGSGLAPGEPVRTAGGKRSHSVNVHIEPEVFQQWVGCSDELPTHLQVLVRSPDQKYHEHIGTPSAAMQTALQQILNCPYRGVTRRLYMESKLWELMTLILVDCSDEGIQPIAQSLKPEDVERIRYAGEILQLNLVDPPSLMGLARQVQINDYKLKVGFKEIFGTTVFGYLHNCRMERARQLLEVGELSVGKVAHAVGIINRSHFAAGFRKKLGINPGCYRKQKLTHFIAG